MRKGRFPPFGFVSSEFGLCALVLQSFLVVFDFVDGVKDFSGLGDLEIWPQNRPPRRHGSTQEEKSIWTAPISGRFDLPTASYGRFRPKMAQKLVKKLAGTG